MNDTLQEFCGQIRAAAAGQRPLCIRGGGSKDWYGQPPRGEILDTRSHRGVLAYEPTELVLTARCGTPLCEVEVLLAQHGQMLAFEPPHWSRQATLGGVVAAGLAGPRRPYAGAVRDFVLGLQLIDGRAEVLNFGGQVMKNVAGYDVSRLMAGSLGCFGLITRVSLKVLPRPFAETTLAFEMPEDEALQRLNRWNMQALPLSGSAWHVGRLLLRLSGAEAAVRAARQKLGGQELAGADDVWAALREQRDPFFVEGEHDLWRLSLPSTTPALALNGKTLIEWGGAQRWLFSDETPQRIRALVAQAGGHATRFRSHAGQGGEFAPLAPPLEKIHRRLKLAFDPAGIFNPGRMYPDF